MSPVPASNIWDLPYPPPGLEVVQWFGYVTADAPSHETAFRDLRETASESFPEANWIIQVAKQRVPDRVYVSGIAVEMREIQL